MGIDSGIEWTQSTWNPWHGCHKISAGCKYCYMFRDKARYGQDPNVVMRSKTTFDAPLKWLEPKLVFTCSWSDFFIEEADPWRHDAYAVMRATPRHTYQVLTKRIERALNLALLPDTPLPNMWLGVSVENCAAKARIAWLRDADDVALRFLSIEPLLEDIGELNLHGIDWVIVGGESGPGARPMHPDWARSIREQCIAAGVQFFFKQWGEHCHFDQLPEGKTRDNCEASCCIDFDRDLIYVGKKAAGRLLDGREWNEMPVGR